MDTDELLASMPTPSDDEMKARRSMARHYVLVILRQGAAQSNALLHQEHLQYLTKLQVLGKLIMNGPILIEHEIQGISVYATDVEEARALAEGDPKVKAGVLVVEALPWMSVPDKPER